MSKREFVQLVKNMRDAQHKRREDKSPEALEKLRLATMVLDSALDDLICEPDPDLLIEVRIGAMPGYDLAKIICPGKVTVARGLELLSVIFENLKENEAAYPGVMFYELNRLVTENGTFLKPAKKQEQQQLKAS